MGECTSREGDSHTCKLMDALFSALHESECCSFDLGMDICSTDCTCWLGYVDVASPVRVGGVMCNGQPQRFVAYLHQQRFYIEISLHLLFFSIEW